MIETIFLLRLKAWLCIRVRFHTRSGTSCNIFDFHDYYFFHLDEFSTRGQLKIERIFVESAEFSERE